MIKNICMLIILILVGCSSGEGSYFEGKHSLVVNDRGMEKELYFDIKRVVDNKFSVTARNSYSEEQVTVECFISDDNNKVLVCEGKPFFKYHENEGSLYQLNSYDSSIKTKLTTL